MLFRSSYDIDAFRLFVFESRFLEVFNVDEETLAGIRGDETRLMHFAFSYLKYLLGISREIDVNSEIAEAQSKKLAQMKAEEDARREARAAEVEKKNAE